MIFAITSFLAGLIAGLIHVLSGPDHLSAIAPYATLHGKSAWRVGLNWGIGHTGGVLVIGCCALLLRSALPVERLSASSERLVGLMLIAIGCWVLFTVWKKRHAPSATPHTHAMPKTRVAFAVGTLHGLAGSSHILGILPALALPTRAAAVVYLGAFGLGTVAGMVFFATLLGVIALRTENGGRLATSVHRLLLPTSALVAIGVGVFWVAAG